MEIDRVDGIVFVDQETILYSMFCVALNGLDKEIDLGFI